jgi:hypothetical protein
VLCSQFVFKFGSGFGVHVRASYVHELNPEPNAERRTLTPTLNLEYRTEPEPEHDPRPENREA